VGNNQQLQEENFSKHVNLNAKAHASDFAIGNRPSIWLHMRGTPSRSPWETLKQGKEINVGEATKGAELHGLLPAMRIQPNNHHLYTPLLMKKYPQMKKQFE